MTEGQPTQRDLFEQPPRKRDRRAYHQAKKATRLAAGLCIVCGLAPHIADRQMCPPCQQKQRVACKKSNAKRRPPKKPALTAEAKASRRAEWRKRACATQKRKAERRKASGLCVRCKAPAVPDKVQCQACIDRGEAKRIAVRAKGLAEGTCTTCGAPRDRPGRKLCTPCNSHRVRQRTDHLAAGLCNCGRLRDRADRRKCPTCRETEAGRKASHVTAGLCPCGRAAPKAGRKWCETCALTDATRSASKRSRWAEQGLCRSCGLVPARPRRKTCKPCAARRMEIVRRWIKRHPDKAVAIWQASRFRRQQRLLMSGGNFTGAEWSALKKAQDYRCLACGRCEPEIKLTVDHVVPVSKGGHNGIRNLQGLCLECNLDKWTDDTDYRPPHLIDGLPDSEDR